MTAEVHGGHNSKVYMFWSIIPRVIHVPSYENKIRYTYIMSVDTNEEVEAVCYVVLYDYYNSWCYA